MPSYFQPDLTGEDTSYFKDTELRTIFKTMQVVEFDMPVFDNDKLEVYQVGSPPVLLVRDTDWTVQVSDIDFDMISRMKVTDPTFTKTLLKSITITKPFVSEYEVQLKYNQLYPNTIDYAPVDPNAQVELTPTLVSNLVEQLAYLERVVLGKVSSYSVASGEIRILEEDNDKLNPDNFITGEIHDIDTSSNIQYIRPIYGAFFKDSVAIRNHVSSTVYTEGTDYEVIEADLAKTAATSNTSGVYLTIKFKTPVIGTVEIDYHAYGNSTDIQTMKGLYSRLEMIEEFLAGGSFVTPSNLRVNPAITQINDQIQMLEGNMRLLLQNGLPTYGDVSTGSALLKKVSAIDSSLHWWSIAELYQVDGSGDFAKADVFKFRITTTQSKMMFEASIAVDVDHMDRTQLKVHNTNVPDDILNTTCPMLRVIYSNLGSTYEGMTLQIGMKLSAVLQETFVIEDMSGRESCWKLIPFDANSTPPEDTAVLLPDDNLVWGTGDNEKRIFVPFNEPMGVSGAIATSVAVTDFGNPPSMTDLTPSIYSDFFDRIDIDLIEGMEFNVRVNGTDHVVVRVPMTMSNEAAKTFECRTVMFVGNTEYSVVVRADFDNNALGVAVVKNQTSTANDTFEINLCKVVFR